MNRSRILTIARADLRQLRQSRDFWVPLAIIAGFMFVVVPTILLYVISTVQDPQLLDKLAQVAGRLPASVRNQIGGKDDATQASYTLAVYLFAPLVTLVPLTVSSAVAANTFVGERERGSGEFLAHSPATTTEIFLGKLLAALVPGFVTAGAGLVTYSLVVNLMLSGRDGAAFFPMGNWWVFMFWLVPALIALAVTLIVTVSSRVTSGAAAQQASSLIALPLVVTAYGVSANAFFGSPTPAWIVGAIAWIAAGVAVWRGARSLTRERLLGVGS